MSEAVEWDVAATKRGARLGLTRDGRNHASYLQLASFFLAFPSNHQPPLIILCSCLRFKTNAPSMHWLERAPRRQVETRCGWP